MTMALCYWILILIWLVLGVAGSWPKAEGKFTFSSVPIGGLLHFLLFLLLGWAVFGAPIK